MFPAVRRKLWFLQQDSLAVLTTASTVGLLDIMEMFIHHEGRYTKYNAR